MKRAIIFVMGLILGALICMGFMLEPKQEVKEETEEQFKEEIIQISKTESEEIAKTSHLETLEVYEVIEDPSEDMKQAQEETYPYFDEGYLRELVYLAKCVEAEAGNQDTLGKRLVVDVILNRVDSEKFPNDIISVIEQEGQFSVVANGSIEMVKASEDTWNAIQLELDRRTDEQILYFRAGDFHSFGTKAYRHGDHFFSY